MAKKEQTITIEIRRGKDSKRFRRYDIDEQNFRGSLYIRKEIENPKEVVLKIVDD